MGTYFELALVSVLVAGGYWGQYFARIPSLRTYGLMQLAAAAMAGLGLVGRKYDDTALGIAGAIGVGTGVCLLVLGPIARGLARRAAGQERFALALRLLDVAEVLAPGSGVADEKALIGAMRELRDGNIERTVDALVAAKDRAPAGARQAIDERIAMLYLAAYRWDEAIVHAETHLFDAIQPPDPQASQAPLRRVLGVAPPVWVELLGAYGYLGDLDRAASMLARLEEACAGRDDAGIWLHRGRMMFLALAGRVDAVQALVEPRKSRHMSPAARTYWIAVAHERRGEMAAAEAAYARARSRSRGRPRVLIDQALQRLPTSKPVELGPELEGVVARVEAAAPPKVAPRAQARGPVATRVLLFSVVAVAIAIAIAFGDSSDVGVLVRAGAMVRGLVHAGEWWRLVSCIFVHVGGVHLLVNAVGLWFLGRLAEELFGSWRTAAAFALSALAGATASFLASPAGISAGASGGIFGLLGAVFLELTWHRKRHRAAWRAGVWGSLAVVAIAQIAVDVVEPITDQWAHGGGLAMGALCGILLSPNASWQRYAMHAARTIAIAFAAACVVAAVMIARTSLADSLDRDWRGSEVVQLVAKDVPAAPAAAIDAVKQVVLKDPDLKDAQVVDARDPIVVLPAGWQGQELVVTVLDPLDNRQVSRVVIAARAEDDGSRTVRLDVPETVARAAPAFFTQLIAKQ